MIMPIIRSVRQYIPVGVLWDLRAPSVSAPITPVPPIFHPYGGSAACSLLGCLEALIESMASDVPLLQAAVQIHGCGRPDFVTGSLSDESQATMELHIIWIFHVLGSPFPALA